MPDIGRLFPNYIQVKQRIPNWFWHAVRVISTLGTIALCVILITQPTLGLLIFWGMFIPVLPLVFFIAPGIWRNLCPLASMNQIPREIGWTKALTIPDNFRDYVILIGIALAIAIITARKYFFGTNGIAVAGLIIACLILAFIGGMLFKGKSGWCQSICPLLPFQRIYGQTPLIKVRNYHCRPCVGCTTNCYDFNPEVSYIADLNSEDIYRANYFKIFAAILPGLVYAFFNVPNPPAISIWHMYGWFVIDISISVSIFYLLTILFRIRDSLIASLYGAIAFNLFYFSIIKISAAHISNYFNLALPMGINYAIDGFIILLTSIWYIKTVRKEKQFFATVEADVEAPAKVEDPPQLTQIYHKVKNKCAVVINELNCQILVDAGTSLLHVLEENKIPIEAGCRMGMCGSDPITVLEGHENLSPPSADEKETINRLNLTENCRMSCCARIRGNVSISLKPTYSEGVHSEIADFKMNTTIKKIVVIGNGVAGMTVVQELKKYNPDCKITLIGKEEYDFYNRMAITRLIYGRSAMNGLSLLPKDWSIKPLAATYLNTTVTHIDNKKKTITLGTSEVIPYDRLVLATGSTGFVPPMGNLHLPEVFILREARHALKIRSFVQHHNYKRVIVIGGGPLGLEAAYALYKFPLEVTVIERGPWLMSQQLDEKAAQYLTSYLNGLGIEIHVDTEVTSIKGENHFQGVSLKNGVSLKADLLLFCIGMTPNTQLAEEIDLNVDRGVLVNQFLQTSDPNIYAIGDVAKIYGRIEGLWTSAINQAETAAKNILGAHEVYQLDIPKMILKVSGIDVLSIGNIRLIRSEDLVISSEKKLRKKYYKLVISNGRIIGALFIGPHDFSDLIIHIITHQIDVTPFFDLIRNAEYQKLAEQLGLKNII